MINFVTRSMWDKVQTASITWQIILYVSVALLLLVIVRLLWHFIPLRKMPDRPQQTKITTITNLPIILDGFEFYPHRQSMAWFKAEVQGAREVWCLWNAGGTARNNLVLAEVRSMKRLILASPEEDNPAVSQFAHAMNEKCEFIIKTTKEVTAIAQQNKITVRWWKGLACNLMVFGNPQDDDAWVIVDIVLPFLSAEQRPQIRIWKSRFPMLYGKLLAVYSEMWNDRTKCVDAPQSQGDSISS